MQFYEPERLQLLWLVPIVIALFIFANQRKNKLLHLFGELGTVKKLIESHSPEKLFWKAVLLTVTLTLVIITLAQPQWGQEKKQLKRKGIDLIFMVDTSLSMLAQDVRPSRIEKAKFLMKSFLKELKGDRVGIVTFAGSGFLQSPLTLDYSAFQLFANSIQVGYIPDPGTNLASGVQTALGSFPNDKNKFRAIVVLTDGEITQGEIEQAIQLAKKEEARLYTIGVGTPDGDPIPLHSSDGKVSGYKKDSKGQVVITKLNENLLQKMAKETGGLYFRASPSEAEVSLIYQHLQNLGKKELHEKEVIEREDRYQSFLLVALVFLLIESLLGDRKRKVAPLIN